MLRDQGKDNEKVLEAIMLEEKNNNNNKAKRVDLFCAFSKDTQQTLSSGVVEWGSVGPCV